MFCEKHKPLKIVKEMEEKDQQTIEEIQSFCKVIDKAVEIEHKVQNKKRIRKQESLLANGKRKHGSGDGDGKVGRKRHCRGLDNKGSMGGSAAQKRWKEKDKKIMFERVKECYLKMRKMRLNVMRVDPNRRFQVVTKKKKKR